MTSRYFTPRWRAISPTAQGSSPPTGEPAVRYPPGFPILVAGLFTAARFSGTPEDVWLRGFTVIALALGTALLYDLARLVLGPRRALIAAVLWATCPFHLWFALQPNSEVPFFPLFFGALWLLQRARPASSWRTWLLVAGGVLLGCAALVRPIALFLPIDSVPVLRRSTPIRGMALIRPSRPRPGGRCGDPLAMGDRRLPDDRTLDPALYRRPGIACAIGISFVARSDGYRLAVDVPPDIGAIADAVVVAQDAGRIDHDCGDRRSPPRADT